MKPGLALVLSFLLALPGPALAQSPSREAYNVLSSPLDSLSMDLLTEVGYVIREDGKVWDKIADSPVRFDEMNNLLARLAGARRLKALLELNLILNRSEGEKKLTSEEREKVRALVRKNWAVFGVGTRKDFRGYFSVQEQVEELDKIPPRFDRGSALLMRDPDPNTAPRDPVAAAAPVSVTAPVPPPAQIQNVAPAYAVAVLPPEPETRDAAPKQFVPRSVLTPFMEPPSLRRPSPFAPRPKPAPAMLVPAYAVVSAAPNMPAGAAPQYVQVQAPPQAAYQPPVQAPAPAPAAQPQTVSPAIAAVMNAMGGPATAPMIFAVPGMPPAAASLPPAAVVPAAPVQVPQAPLMPAAPPPATALPPAAPAAPPAKADGIVYAQPGGRRAATVAPLPANNSLFGSALPNTPPPAVPQAEIGVLKEWKPGDAPAAAAPSAAVAAVPGAVPNAAPAAPQAAAAAIGATPAVVAPVAPRPAPLADATQADYDAFILSGPYSREGQHLLKLIAEKSPEFCRAILRRTVVRGAPLVVIDGARAGSDRRAGYAASEGRPGVTVALSPGPVLVERKSGMFSKTAIALPEDPRAWAELGVPVPDVDALKKGAAASSQENGPWGATSVYPDRSKRGTYSAEEQAGELLERLLLLGLEREGFGTSFYAARAWARAARLLMSARIAEERGSDAFLDPDRRLELREWIERGDESDDLMIGAWSSARGNALDPRRGGPDGQIAYERGARSDCKRALLADHLAEAARAMAARVRTVEALQEAGLVSGAAARASAEKAVADEAAARKALLASPPSCEGRFGADEGGLRRSGALLAEVSRAERAFRERKTKGASRDE